MRSWRLSLDRLELLGLADRNGSLASLGLDAAAAAVVALAAAAVLRAAVFHDLALVAFAFVTAGAHFRH